jgi:hypothetical protein
MMALGSLDWRLVRRAAFGDVAFGFLFLGSMEKR